MLILQVVLLLQVMLEVFGWQVEMQVLVVPKEVLLPFLVAVASALMSGPEEMVARSLFKVDIPTAKFNLKMLAGLLMSAVVRLLLQQVALFRCSVGIV